jgi:hypothetical protein
MILDGVVSPAFENIGDVSPFVCLVSVQQIKDPFLFSGPGSLPLNHWIEMIVPSFSALLSNSSREMVGNLSPFLRTVNVDQVQQESIFNISPRSLNQRRVEHLLPSMKALNIRPSLETLSNFLPVLTTVDPDSFSQLRVFTFSPVPFHLGVISSGRLLFLIFCWSSFV